MATVQGHGQCSHTESESESESKVSDLSVVVAVVVAVVQPDNGREDNKRSNAHSGHYLDYSSASSSTVAPLVSSTGPSVPFNYLNDCPLCNKHLTTNSLLWQHINVQHLPRGDVPVIDFFSDRDRLICASCGWAYH